MCLFWWALSVGACVLPWWQHSAQLFFRCFPTTELICRGECATVARLAQGGMPQVIVDGCCQYLVHAFRGVQAHVCVVVWHVVAICHIVEVWVCYVLAH